MCKWIRPIKIIMYYKSHTINNLISKNNHSRKPNPLKPTNILYKVFM